MLLATFMVLIGNASGYELTWLLVYTKPAGTLFLHLLQSMIVPLIITSLVTSMRNIEDTKELSRIATKTLLLYMFTTLLAVCLGVVFGSWIQPGKMLSTNLQAKLLSQYHGVASLKGVDIALELFPNNLFCLFSNNDYLLQIVLWSLCFGIALLQIAPEQQRPIIKLCTSLQANFVAMINSLMQLAPFGIFALFFSQLIEMGKGNSSVILAYLVGLIPYMMTVLCGLALMCFGVYPLLLKCFSDVGWRPFFKAVGTMQSVAFSTSSSTLALPTSIKEVGKLGVPKQITNFVLPLGAVINIDGTALYEGIAVMFITQAFGIDLSWYQQFFVVLYVTISSIGIGGIPSGSLVTIAFLLSKLGIPIEPGIALIFLPDRILDMCRSATNVTGDAAVAILVAASEKETLK